MEGASRRSLGKNVARVETQEILRVPLQCIETPCMQCKNVVLNMCPFKGDDALKSRNRPEAMQHEGLVAHEIQPHSASHLSYHTRYNATQLRR
jgi:hypothetical protein